MNPWWAWTENVLCTIYSNTIRRLSVQKFRNLFAVLLIRLCLVPYCGCHTFNGAHESAREWPAAEMGSSAFNFLSYFLSIYKTQSMLSMLSRQNRRAGFPQPPSHSHARPGLTILQHQIFLAGNPTGNQCYYYSFSHITGSFFPF